MVPTRTRGPLILSTSRSYEPVDVFATPQKVRPSSAHIIVGSAGTQPTGFPSPSQTGVVGVARLGRRQGRRARVTPTGGSILMAGSVLGRLTYSARISVVSGTLVAPSGGLTARMRAAAIVAARLPCWARRTMTNPPTASAKTRTRTVAASCFAQLFIRPNNVRALEKVRQALPQQLDAAGVLIGR